MQKLSIVLIGCLFALESSLYCNLALSVRDNEHAEKGRYAITEEIIMDNKTGLTWHKKGLSINAVLSKIYPDAKEGSKQSVSTEVINEYLQSINTDGKSDWRLPTNEEIETLKEFTSSNIAERLIWYLTSTEDESTLGFVVLYAHKYIDDSIFDEPNPLDHASSQKAVIIPVSGNLSELK